MGNRGHRILSSSSIKTLGFCFAAMSAGVCGKRLGFEDIFGSPSSAPSGKRSRCSLYGSPVRCSDLRFGMEDKLSLLVRMFPSVDPKVVESVLDSHGLKVDDAVKNLHALCLGNDCTTHEKLGLNSVFLSNDNAIEGSMSTQASERNAEAMQDESLKRSRMLHNEASWVDLFVQEMMDASDWGDVRGRTTKFLEAVERSILTHSTNVEQQDIIVPKEQPKCLLTENENLKREFAARHKLSLEQEEKLKEVQQLMHIVSQCQEQVQTLEMKNYTLNVNLQRAQSSSSIPSQFHPDIF